MTYDERRVYSDGAGCQHGTEVYRHEPYRHYCMDCGADLDEIMDLVGLQADLEELEKTDAIVKAAATSYANMVARVTGAQPDAELSEHERLTRALDAAQDEIERRISECESHRVLIDAVRAEREAETAWEQLTQGPHSWSERESEAFLRLSAARHHRRAVVDSIGGA